MGRRKVRRKKEPKKKIKKEFWFGMFIIIIMVSSGFGIMFGGFGNGGGETHKYGDYSFTARGGTFSTRLDGVQLSFYYLPQEVESIELDPAVIEVMKGTVEIDTTSDFDSPAKAEIAISQLYMSQTLGKVSSIYLRSGFLNATEQGYDVVTCDDATDLVPVIVYRYHNESSIENDGTCVTITAGSQEEFLRLTTRMLYGVLSVI